MMNRFSLFAALLHRLRLRGTALLMLCLLAIGLPCAYLWADEPFEPLTISVLMTASPDPVGVNQTVTITSEASKSGYPAGNAECGVWNEDWYVDWANSMDIDGFEYGEYEPGPNDYILIKNSTPGSKTLIVNVRLYFDSEEGVCGGANQVATVEGSVTYTVASPTPTPVPTPTVAPTATPQPTATPVPGGGGTGGGTGGGGTGGGGTGGGGTGGECNLYTHAGWIGVGTIVWTLDASGFPTSSVNGQATERRVANNLPDHNILHSYIRTQLYDVRNTAGVLTRYVEYRADASCDQNGANSTWLRGSAPVPDSDFGSGSLQVLKKTSAATTTVPAKYDAVNGASVKGDLYVALDVSSDNGFNSGWATIRIRDDGDDPAVSLTDPGSHVDVYVDMTNGVGWEKEYDPDGPGPVQEGWWPVPQIPAPGGGTVLDSPSTHQGHYRYLIPWATTSHPWNGNWFNQEPGDDGLLLIPGSLHNRNGKHTVSLSSVNGTSIPYEGEDELGLAYGLYDGYLPLDEVSVTLDNPVPQVTFEGLARACAGGVAVDGVHSFTITGTAKLPDGSLVPNTEFKLSFEGNKGHDYGDGRDKKIAYFVTTDSTGAQKRVESYTAYTDNQGRITVNVLSSDIISQAIKVRVKSVNKPGQGINVGSQICDFAATEGKRGWIDPNNPDENYPIEDDGWLFNQRWLDTTGEQTTAKMYLQFKVDPNKGDIESNYKRINGHKILFAIYKIVLKEGVNEDPSQIKNYAVLVDRNTNIEGTESHDVSHNDGVNGATSTIVKAKILVKNALKIYFEAYDQTQWDN